MLLTALLVLAFTALLFVGAGYALTGGRRPSTMTGPTELALGDQPVGDSPPVKMTLKGALQVIALIILYGGYLIVAPALRKVSIWSVEVSGRPHVLTVLDLIGLLLLVWFIVEGVVKRHSWRWWIPLMLLSTEAQLWLR